MKSQEIIHIAVAETSMIVRSGLVAVLRRLPDLNVQTVEITSKEGLQHCMEAHQPEILIVNPQFEGWFDLEAFKQQYARQDMKIVSLICTVVDANQLKGYDESINLFDDLDAVAHKISTLMNVNEEEDSDQNSLSQREKRNYRMRCTRNDEQGDCRTAFHFRSYRHYAPAKHYPQITDSFCCRAHHLCHSEQTGGTE